LFQPRGCQNSWPYSSVTGGHRDVKFWIFSFLICIRQYTKFHKILRQSLPGGGWLGVEWPYLESVTKFNRRGIRPLSKIAQRKPVRIERDLSESLFLDDSLHLDDNVASGTRSKTGPLLTPVEYQLYASTHINQILQLVTAVCQLQLQNTVSPTCIVVPIVLKAPPQRSYLSPQALNTLKTCILYLCSIDWGRKTVLKISLLLLNSEWLKVFHAIFQDKAWTEKGND
jgi:hypothetical protein